MTVMGMVHATMAGLKYSYCGQMKKLAWFVEQKQTATRDHGSPPVSNPCCVTCRNKVKHSRCPWTREYV